MTWTSLGSTLPLPPPREPRERRLSTELNRTFSAGVFGFHQSWDDAPGLVVNCAFGANSLGQSNIAATRIALRTARTTALAQVDEPGTVA